MKSIQELENELSSFKQQQKIEKKQKEVQNLLKSMNSSSKVGLF